MDFQFVSGNTNEILKELMNASYNYAEYTSMLCKKALLESSSDEIIILALWHSSLLSLKKIERSIIDTHKDRRTIIPYHLSDQALDNEDWELAINALEEAIEKNESEWQSFLYLLKLYQIATTHKIGSILEDTTKSRIEKVVDRNPDLKCYSSKFYLYHAIRLRQEGDTEGAGDACNQGLMIAESYDDKLHEARLMWEKGELEGIYKFGKKSTINAKQILIKAKMICEELGDIRGLMLIKSLIQVISHMRGEYTEALNINFENLESLELIGEKPVVDLHNVAFMYNEIGDGNEALEWAKLAVDNAKNYPINYPYALLDYTWALINLNRLKEATEYLDLARKLIFKSGIEAIIAFEYLVTGLLERAQGDYDSAFESFKNSLDINIRNGRNNRVSSCLIKLAETEVQTFEPTIKNRDENFAGYWHERLEKHANEMELPGVIGIELVIRGELRLKQGREDEAHGCIQQVLEMSEWPGLDFLKKMAHSLYQKSPKFNF